jgi:predicted deacylase
MSAPMLKSVTFHAAASGPRLLVFGAVHGDEVCGTLAINRIIPEFDSGKFNLKRGRLTFVPICNPRAYEQNVRYTERNLNRNLLPQSVPDCYEAVLGNMLCPLIRDCDVLLDIHSYHVGGAAFIFIDPADKANIDFATALGADTVLSNFAGAITATGRSTGDAGNWSIGTTEYARMFGAMSVTLECGQHRAPEAPEVAYQSIIGALTHLGMIDAPVVASNTKTRHVVVESVVYRDDEGHLAQPWQHLDNIKADSIIATRANGEVLRAKKDSVIILPRADAELGAEWYYLGHEAAIA